MERPSRWGWRLPPRWLPVPAIFWMGLALTAALVLLSGPADAAESRSEPPPAVSAAAAVLIDATTGQILYGRNPHQERHMASTTKVMTAVLALELGDLDEEVTVSPYAADTPGSTMHLRPGERYRLRDC